MGAGCAAIRMANRPKPPAEAHHGDHPRLVRLAFQTCSWITLPRLEATHALPEAPHRFVGCSPLLHVEQTSARTSARRPEASRPFVLRPEAWT